MSSITIIHDLNQRINRTEFDPRKESIEHNIHLRDFIAGTRSKVSAIHRKSFDEFLYPKSTTKLEEKFLDFYCPGCKLPIRIIYNDVEFAMGAYYYVITEIIEMTN